jgi:integrase
LRGAFTLVASARAVHRPVATSSHGHKAVTVESRAGTVRPHPKVLRLPTFDETDRWLEAVRLQRGATKALVCELILETAIRRSEAAEWRVDTLPLDPAQWHIVGENVQVTIKYGAKGSKYRDENSEEHGPPRAIFIPLAFAYRLHEYRETRRLTALAKWVKAGATQAERARRRRELPVHLFLSEYSGVPVSRGAIYEAWTEVANQPFKGWSPHGGRHLWACRKLLSGLERNARIAGRLLDAMPGDWVTGQSQTDLDIIIRPQLGHVDRETTLRYLQWVHEAAVLPGIADKYLRLLEETVDG